MRARGAIVSVSGLTLPYALWLVRSVTHVNRYRRATSRMIARSCRFWLEMRGVMYEKKGG